MESPIALFNRYFTAGGHSRESGRWRFVFLAFLAAYYLSFALFPQLFRFVGVTHFWGWFLDSHAIVAANDAAAAGLDVHASNPFDRLGRPHVYPRLWLILSELGLTREDNFLLGGVFVAGFFVASAWWLGPRSLAEALWYFAILSSGSIVLGVERANNDLFIFLLLMLVIPLMSSDRPWVRNLAIAPVVLATALKLYPAVAILVFIARGTFREICGRVALVCVLLAAFFYFERNDLMSMSGLVPAPRGLISFGAEQLLAGFDLGKLLAVGLIVGIALVAVALCRPWRWFGEWKALQAYPREWLGLILGATLLTGCFFSGSSYVYRLVFCVMMGPFLWRVTRGAGAPNGVVRLAWATSGLMLFMLWADTTVLAVNLSLMVKGYSQGMVDAVTAYMSVRGPLILGFFICLLCFLMQFVREAILAVWSRQEERSDSTMSINAAL